MYHSFEKNLWDLNRMGLTLKSQGVLLWGGSTSFCIFSEKFDQEKNLPARAQKR